MLENTIIAIDSIVAYINPILYKLVAAILIIFGGFIIGRLASAILQKVLQDINIDSRTKDITPFNKQLSQKIVLVTRISIYTVSVIFALIFLGWIFAASVIIITLLLITVLFSIMFFIRDILPNLIAWFTIRKKVIVGRQQIINKETGKVIHKTLFAVHLQKKNNDHLIFPNRIIESVRTKKS